MIRLPKFERDLPSSSPLCNWLCHDCVSSVCPPCQCPVSCFKHQSTNPRPTSAPPPGITLWLAWGSLRPHGDWPRLHPEEPPAVAGRPLPVFPVPRRASSPWSVCLLFCNEMQKTSQRRHHRTSRLFRLLCLLYPLQYRESFKRGHATGPHLVMTILTDLHRVYGLSHAQVRANRIRDDMRTKRCWIRALSLTAWSHLCQQFGHDIARIEHPLIMTHLEDTLATQLIISIVIITNHTIT